VQNYYFVDNVSVLFNTGDGHFVPDPILGTYYNNSNPVHAFTAFPNPFTEEIRITFSLNQSETAELSLYDLQGMFITSLINQKLNGGFHSIKWRGLDKFSRPCKPGAYVAYLKVNGKVCQTIKVIKI
jgi:hypothetical protein